jgi:uncharacterized membrane protein (DUF485 family)
MPRPDASGAAQRKSPMPNPSHGLHAIAARRWRIALTLAVIMLVVYFGFILLVAFAKPFLSTLLTTGLSLGILLGALVIVTAWVISLVYVVWANRYYDKSVEEAAHSTAHTSGRRA